MPNDLTEVHETKLVEQTAPLAAEKDLFCPDAIYECDNDLEIPSLRLDMQAKRCTIPFLAFGEQKRTYQMNGTGTLHFYVDDYRWGDSLYQHPEKILKHNPMNIIEPMVMYWLFFSAMPCSRLWMAISILSLSSSILRRLSFCLSMMICCFCRSSRVMESCVCVVSVADGVAGAGFWAPVVVNIKTKVMPIMALIH